jgi:YfiH family protein
VGDGLVSAEAGITLAVRAADCVPVLFADTEARVIGACHCGRPGLVAGIVAATLAAMRDLGASRITAWVGPHVCGRCYEVPPRMQVDVAAVEPATRATTSWGTPSLDLGAGVRAQLEREHVGPIDLSFCTRESSDLFSYRREGKLSGRQAGMIRIAV